MTFYIIESRNYYCWSDHGWSLTFDLKRIVIYQTLAEARMRVDQLKDIYPDTNPTIKRLNVFISDLEKPKPSGRWDL